MGPITIVKVEPLAMGQWHAWDKEGRFWYLRFLDGHGTISKTYDAEKFFYEFHSEIRTLTIEEMCRLLSIKLDLLWHGGPEGKRLTFEDPPRIGEAPMEFQHKDLKINIDVPRPGQVVLVVSNGSKWGSMSIDRSHFHLGNFEIIDQVLRELDGIIE